MQIYDKFLTARVTPEDLRTITAQAKAVHRTRSDYVRGIINALKQRDDLRREVNKILEAEQW